MRSWSQRTAPAALALLAACSASEDPLPTIAVRFSPATVRATFRGGRQTINMPDAEVSGTLSPMPSGNLYVVIVEGQPILYWNPLSYLWTTSTGFTADLLFDPALAGGTYTGKMTLRICKDAGCASEYPMTGNELPYELTVADPVAVAAYVSGTPVTASAPIVAPRGATVRLESSEAAWFSAIQSNASFSATTTPTSWESPVTAPVGQTGYVYVDVTTEALPQGTYHATIVVSG